MENEILKHRQEVINNIEKSFGVDIEKAEMNDIEKAKHQVGDVMTSNGQRYVWTEYAPGKYDWHKMEGGIKGIAKKISKKIKEIRFSKIPKGIKMPDEDAWVEIYDKSGKKVKEDFFENLDFDPNEKWNEKDGNYDIKGGGKMVVPDKKNSRKEV